MKVRIFFAVNILLIAGLSVQAQTIGYIDYMLGTVEISRDGEVLKNVDLGTPIENLDIVKTLADSQVSIAFDPSAGLSGSLELESATSIVIRQDMVAGKKASDVKLLTGAIGVKVKRLAGSASTVQVRTPTSVLGVRGTEFNVVSFNGSALVACEEGEVFCAAYSEITTTRSVSADGISAVPGTLVEVLESGTLKDASFPEGDYKENWNSIQKKWKEFHIELVSENPAQFIDQFSVVWPQYVARLEAGLNRLKNNKTFAAWLENAKRGKGTGTYGDFVKEGHLVMNDMTAMRGDMILAMVAWYRLEELIPYVKEMDMGKRLANGQTLRSFISEYRTLAKKVSTAAALFNAAEKQYMLRSGGMSPFSGF